MCGPSSSGCDRPVEMDVDEILRENTRSASFDILKQRTRTAPGRTRRQHPRRKPSRKFSSRTVIYKNIEKMRRPTRRVQRGGPRPASTSSASNCAGTCCQRGREDAARPCASSASRLFDITQNRREIDELLRRSSTRRRKNLKGLTRSRHQLSQEFAQDLRQTVSAPHAAPATFEEADARAGGREVISPSHTIR